MNKLQNNKRQVIFFTIEMGAEVQSTNKKIAKNAVFLYIRSLLTLAISLYTSRIVLRVLGVEDFGIYNVVGGIVSMFSFLSGTISGVTQRYLTYELGTGNTEKLKKVFNTAMAIHAGIASLIIILAETIGLWFVLNKLVIHHERMSAALWVYQFSIASCVVFMLSIPYNACIIAHERMSAFAYISIIEVTLKLAVLYVLMELPYDKLIVYALLIFVIQLFIRFIYNVYCSRHFVESRYRFSFDGTLAREMLGFSSWTLFGGFACVGYSQGINILLNMFFGPIVNAARAIAMQVDNAVQTFVSNFQVAVNPQIIKSYANNDLARMQSLIYKSSRYSFYLLLLMALPIFLEAHIILRLWLHNVPDHTVSFLRITLLVVMVNTLANPLMTAASATGKIKKYQIMVGSILLLIIPTSYIALALGCSSESVFYIYLLFSLIAQFIRLWLVRSIIDLPLLTYCHKVMSRCATVTLFACVVPVVTYLAMQESFLRLIVTLFFSSLSILLFVILLGMEQNEKALMYNKIKEYGKRFMQKK